MVSGSSLFQGTTLSLLPLFLVGPTSLGKPFYLLAYKISLVSVFQSFSTILLSLFCAAMAVRFGTLGGLLQDIGLLWHCPAVSQVF